MKNKLQYRVRELERIPTPEEEEEFLNSKTKYGWKLLDKNNYRYIFVKGGQDE